MPAPFSDTVPRGGFALAVVLAAALAARAVGLGQPVVENYVGRQVPTAMVARNLDRVGGFLDPRLDVAPLPNRFLVEPPLYELAAVGWRRLSGWPLTDSGRFVSALGIVLGAWGVYGLSARRSGRAVGLLAAAAFASFPVTLRYGRAFQPDALMIGSVVAGMRCWDEYESGLSRLRLAAGFVLLSVGIALKATSAFVFIPLIIVVIVDRRAWKLALAAATLLPAILWYAHAAALLAEPGGSRASADNSALWLRALNPAALVRPETLGHVARFLGVRAFTPLGPWLALAGLFLTGTRYGSLGIDHLRDDTGLSGARGWTQPVPRHGFRVRYPWHPARLWRVWGASALLAMAAVASKLHHEYYWLALAPVIAAGVAELLAFVAARSGRGAAVAIGLVLLFLDGIFAASTWRTPPEWRSLEEAAAVVRARVPADAWVAAPEALLFFSDRKGCRLEYSPEAARRAAAEWGPSAAGPAVNDAAALVAFYRSQGAYYFADVVPPNVDPARDALHAAVRRRYNILVDRPGVLLADLTGHDEGADAPHDHTE